MRTLRPLVCGLLVAIVGSVMAPVNAPAETSDRILAFVNDEVITVGDLKAHMNALLEQEEIKAPDPAQIDDMKRAVLQRLIEERLILQEAKRMGLTISEEEVANRLRSVQERFKTPEEYHAMLQEGDLTEEQVKKHIRQQLLVQKAIDRAVRSKIVLSPSELAKVSPSSSTQVDQPQEEVQAAHLLVRVTEQRSEQGALRLANQWHEQLVKGADFEQLARSHSEDASSAADGGRLGWTRQGELLPELDEALFRLKPGELSDPIRTRLGFHLVKVLERRSLSTAEASASRQRLEQQLYQEKFAKAMQQWLEGLKQRAYIEIIPE